MNRLLKIDMTVLLILTAMMVILGITISHEAALVAKYMTGLPLIGAGRH